MTFDDFRRNVHIHGADYRGDALAYWVNAAVNEIARQRGNHWSSPMPDIPDKIEPDSDPARRYGASPPDDRRRSSYDIRSEVERIEARIRARSLANVTLTAADERWLAAIGIAWDDEEEGSDYE